MKPIGAKETETKKGEKEGGKGRTIKSQIEEGERAIKNRNTKMRQRANKKKETNIRR
jgi:hypothetical protein